MTTNDSKICTVGVYYRDKPMLLMLFLNKDPNASFIKDGVLKLNNHDCPRMTITLNTCGDETQDKKRILKLSKILDELENNNQIIASVGFKNYL